MEENFQKPSQALKAWLDKRGVTAKQLAADTILTITALNAILAGKRRISAETATVLGAYFGTTVEYWMSIQARSDATRAHEGSRPHQINSGELTVGGTVMWVYVLADERRVMDAGGFYSRLNLKNRTPASGAYLGKLLDSPFLKSDDISDLAWRMANPIAFTNHLGTKSFGYDAETIIEFCKALMAVRRVGGLAQWTKPIVDEAEMLVISFAKVGIIALIDEATGYQTRRQQDALQRLFDVFLLKEYAAWAKRFPDDFYIQMFRLKGWQMSAVTSHRPPVVGRITNEIVYQRLAPKILEELRRLNPLVESGRRKQKHHQWLTPDIGHPALNQHLFVVCALMRAHPNWNSFFHALQLALPKLHEGVQLEFGDYNPGDN